MGRFDDPKPWAPKLKPEVANRASAKLRQRSMRGGILGAKFPYVPRRYQMAKLSVGTWRRALVAMLLPGRNRDISRALGINPSDVSLSVAELRAQGLLDAAGRLKQITPP